MLSKEATERKARAGTAFFALLLLRYECRTPSATGTFQDPDIPALDFMHRFFARCRQVLKAYTTSCRSLSPSSDTRTGPSATIGGDRRPGIERHTSTESHRVRGYNAPYATGHLASSSQPICGKVNSGACTSKACRKAHLCRGCRRRGPYVASAVGR